jgi:hypothetical protein
MKLVSRRLRSLEELWAIEDEFPAVCGPDPVSYAARHGLKLSKSYLQLLSGQQPNGNGTKTISRKRKVAPVRAI